MRKTKFPSGVTLIELVIVLAISSVLIVIAATTNRTRGKRDFDNGMKQLVTEIKTIQNNALSGIGPDVNANCKDLTEIDDDTSNNPTVCPSGSLFGQAVTFGTSATSPLFGSVQGAAGEDLGKNYQIDYLASTATGANGGLNFLRVRPFRPNAAFSATNSTSDEADTKKIPSNIGYKGSCYTYYQSDGTTGDSGCDFSGSAATNSPPIITTFVKYGQNANGTTAIATSSIPLQMYTFRAYKFDRGEPQSVVILGYSSAAQKDVSMFFTDTTGKYKAVIHLIPKKGQVNLCFDKAEC